MYQVKSKLIWVFVLAIAIVISSSTVTYAKGKTDFYAGGESNVRRVAIKKISKNYIWFDMAYSDMKEVGAKNIKANRKSGKFY